MARRRDTERRPRRAPGNERGMTLVVALWILVLLGVLGAAANVVSRTDVGIAGNLRNETTAFHIAEGGLQRALGTINTDIFWVDNLADPTDAFAGDDAFGLGSYTVEVYQDDPIPEAIRVRATGHVDGSGAASAVEAVLTPAPFTAQEYATFSCGVGDFGSQGDTFIDGSVYAKGNVKMGGGVYGDMIVTNGSVYSVSQIDMDGLSSVTGGSVLANGSIHLDSGAALSVSGDVVSGGTVSQTTGTVGGSITQNAVPLPVEDLCTGAKLAESVITTEDIQDYRDNATDVHNGPWNVAGGTVVGPDVIWAKNNVSINGDITCAGNVVLIVDGGLSIDGSMQDGGTGCQFTIVVPQNGVTVAATVTVDGAIQVGRINRDGTGVFGSNFKVMNGGDITVNGSVNVINNNVLANSGGVFRANYTPLDNDTMKKRYGIAQWRKL